MAYRIACAVRMPLPRLQSGWGYFYNNSLRGARAAASVCGRGGVLLI